MSVSLSTTAATVTSCFHCRLALERCGTAREAVDTVTSLLTKHGQGGPCCEDPSYGQWTYHSSFLFADRREAWTLETAGRLWVAKKITGGLRTRLCGGSGCCCCCCCCCYSLSSCFSSSSSFRPGPTFENHSIFFHFYIFLFLSSSPPCSFFRFVQLLLRLLRTKNDIDAARRP